MLLHAEKPFKIVYADVETAKEILITRDEFINAMSPIDRSIRMKTTETVSVDSFVNFLGQNALEWNDAEIEILKTAMDSILPVLQEIKLDFPDTVYFAKTTGEEEGGGVYTRQNAIIFPGVSEEVQNADLIHLIYHELFHILTRNNPEYQDDLYQIIEFYPCNEIEFPDTLKNRRITNPDAPHNNYYIEVEVEGEEIPVVPIVVSSVRMHQVTEETNLIQSLSFGLMALENHDGMYVPKMKDGLPVLYYYTNVPSFMEKVGHNTEYVLHPEEILAENFVLIFSGDHDIPDPEIPQKMREILFGERN